MTVMVSIDELLPRLMVEVPELPEPLALVLILEAARQFCDRTHAWTETYSETIAAPEFELLIAPTDTRVVTIHDPRLDGTELTPITIVELDSKQPGWQSDTETGSARYIVQTQPDAITIYPRQTGTLTARVVLQPSLKAGTVPDFLVEDYVDVIACGAAGKALMMPGKEWENAAAGRSYRVTFEDKLNTLNTKITKSRLRAPLRSKPSFF